jgi:hypothetical protein
MRSVINICPFCGKEIKAHEEVMFISRANTGSAITGYRKEKRVVVDMTNEAPRRAIHIGCWNGLFMFMWIDNYARKPVETLTGASKVKE